MVLFRCSYTLSISNCCHKVSNILSCDFVTSFSSENEVKSLSKFSPGHSSWSSGLVKRVHFESKTCSIQTESYTFYSRNFAESLQKTFRTNLSIIFKSSLVRIFFLWARVHFRWNLLHNSLNCLLPNWWQNICFYYYSFYTKVSHLFLQVFGLL